MKEKWPNGSLTELKKRKCKALHQESWLDRKWELIFWKASLREKSWKERAKELIKGKGFLQNQPSSSGRISTTPISARGTTQ